MDIRIEVYQQDWMPGFGAFLDDGSVREGANPKVAINIGGFVESVRRGDVESGDIPYAVAETIMHEVMHVLEAWAEVEFDEERVEELLKRYRECRFG